MAVDQDQLFEDYEAGPRLPGRKRPTRAASKESWRQDALFELDELGDFYGLERAKVSL
jgi:hypothetical protein